MSKTKTINFLKEAGALLTYNVIINAILGLFYYITALINGFYLLDTGYNYVYIVGYLIVLLIVFFVSIVLEPYKLTKNADVEFIRNYVKISAKPHYFSEILVYLLSALCTFVLGLALGPQGPSIYVGMLAVLLFYKFIFKNSNTTKEEQVILGSSIGYTVAFLNPIAGVCFAMEKSKCKMKMGLIIKLIVSLVITYFLQTIFRNRYLSEYFIEIQGHMNYWLLFAIPLMIAVLCVIGLLLLKLFRAIGKHINAENKYVKVFIYFLIILIPLAIKIYEPRLLGSGLLALDWIFSDLSLSIIAIYGAIRIVFTFFSVKTRFSGGVGGSIIIIGAILGRLIAGTLGLFIELTQTDVYILTIATALPVYGMFTKEKYASLALIFSFGNPLYLIAPCIVGYLSMIGIHHSHIALRKHLKTKKLAKTEG